MAKPRKLDALRIRRLRERLLSWYRRERRDLPWRRTRDPYCIWLSEIMLQQTRVAAVLDRYDRFLARFPDVQSLAAADIAEVLALWSGLGYYRRARALHATAQQIAQSGIPETAEQWRRLPGIGRYTAAAIASIAFDEPCAVVDGNVERVVRRVTGDPRSPIAKIWEAAEAWLSPKSPGDFNQAMMELGATVCSPAAPQCNECPIHAWCATRGVLPVKASAARVRREVAYAIARRRGSVFLKQRAATESLMPGLWELPEILPNGHAPAFSVRHAITVTDFRVQVHFSSEPQSGGRWVKIDTLSEVPLTGLARKILRHAEII